MTVLEALRTSVGYPLDSRYLERIMLDRCLDPQAEYNGPAKDFMLARADVYMALVTTPNISEDGFSLTVADRSMLASMAESIYRRGEPSGANISTARSVLRDCSDVW